MVDWSVILRTIREFGWGAALAILFAMLLIGGLTTFFVCLRTGILTIGRETTNALKLAEISRDEARKERAEREQERQDREAKHDDEIRQIRAQYEAMMREADAKSEAEIVLWRTMVLLGKTELARAQGTQEKLASAVKQVAENASATEDRPVNPQG